MFLHLCVAASLSATCGLHIEKISNSDIDVEECVFSDLSYPNYGGAVLINSQSARANMSFDSFYNCCATGTSSIGGAIYCFASMLTLSSICFSSCSATQGSFFYFETNSNSKILVNSVMTSQRFNRNGYMKSSIKVICESMNSTFLNASDATKGAISFASVIFSFLKFCTLSNLSCDYSLLHLDDCLSLTLDMSNIIGNSGFSLEFIYREHELSTFSSCVLVGNNFEMLINGEYSYSTNCTIVMKGCWFDESKETIISKETEIFKNLSLELCNFISTKTLSFIDQNLITDGVTCGIPHPSPSASMTSFQYLRQWNIIWLVVGTIALVSIFFTLVWYFARRSALRQIQAEAVSMSLLSNSEKMVE